MIYKKSTYFFLITINCIIFLGMIVLIIFDPFQIYHKTFFSKMQCKVHEDMRIQASGIINNYKFDSIILGTSMLSNTSAKEASNILGGEFVNLSIYNSDYHERSLILTYVLQHKKLKKVIYSMDEFYLDQRENKTNDIDFLYDENPFNDVKIYSNIEILKCLYPPLSQKCSDKFKDFDQPTAWYREEKFSRLFGGLIHWFQADEKLSTRKALASLAYISAKIQQRQHAVVVKKTQLDNLVSKAKKYVDTYLLDIAKAYPDTEFIFVFPPYSRIQFALWLQENPLKYQTHQKMIEYIVQQSTKYPNIKVFGYENLSFCDDIGNYFDLKHFSHLFNSGMLESFKQNEGLLTQENVDGYLKETYAKANMVDLHSIGEFIKNFYPFKYGISEQKITNQKLVLKGWFLSFPAIDEVTLHIDHRTFQDKKLHMRKDIIDKNPEYGTKKTGFLFKDIEITNVNQVELLFKFKGVIMYREKLNIDAKDKRSL